MKKEDYLNQLRNNDVFKDVLSRASSDAERRAIKAYAEEFMMGFVNSVLEPASKALEKDPEALIKSFLEVEKDLINNSSGSSAPQE